MSGVADVEAIEPPNRIAEERCLTPARRGLQLRELEAHDELAVASERRYLSEASMKLLNPTDNEQEVAEPAALTA